MEKKLRTKIKEIKDTAKESLQDWRDDTMEYAYDHPTTAGFLAGTAIIWCIMIGAHLVTGKKWGLVD